MPLMLLCYICVKDVFAILALKDWSLKIKTFPLKNKVLFQLGLTYEILNDNASSKP